MAPVKVPEVPPYLPFPYNELAENALAHLRAEEHSTEGWQDVAIKNNICIQRKSVPGDSSSIPLVRGAGVLQGVTPLDLFPVISLPGCRAVWDERFIEGNILERYAQHKYKFYSVHKGFLFVQPRDFVGQATTSINDDGSVEIVLCSVPEDESAGPVPGRTRGELTISGWSLRPRGEDTTITYIVKTNLKGSIPTSIISQLVTQIPGCVAKVYDYYKSYGSPPYVLPSAEPKESILLLERFDHTKKRYTSLFSRKSADLFEIAVDVTKMYKPTGFVSSIVGEGAEGVVVNQTDEGVVTVIVGEGGEGKTFELVIEPKA